MIAWVVDDYGDGVISNNFFGFNIPQGQKDIADKTRKLIAKKIGTYKDHQYASNNPTKSSPEMLARAERLANLTLQLQWVRGNASKAEDSFFKINEEAAPINETEKTLLRSRKMPNAIAARAIIRSGTGHQYWSDFFHDKKEEIKALAKEINDLLFIPALETPIKTLDIPVAGKGYSTETLPLVFDLINVSNGIERRKSRGKEVVFFRKEGDKEIDLTNDETGDQTIVLLKRTRKILFRISDDHPSSLGLHPAVYFYSNTGRYQITSLLAMIELIKEYESKNNFSEFISIREKFENFLMTYKIFVNQSTLKYGSGLKGYRQLKKLYSFIISKIKIGESPKEVVQSLISTEEYKYLNPGDIDQIESNQKDFNTEAKSSVFLLKALQNPLKCSYCRGLIHRNSASIDHIIRKEEGGLGNTKNGDVMHPFCNTTMKH